MTRSRMRAAFCAFSAMTVAAAQPAHAGAWPQPVGQGLIIVPFTASKATDGFDSSGKRIPRSDYRKIEVAPYAEYGLTKSLTLVGSFAWLRDQTDYYGYQFRQQGFSRAEAGVRVSLGTWQGTRFALQPLLAVHGTSSGDDPYASRRGDIDEEIALVSGRSFHLFGVEGFTDTMVAYRHRPAGRPAQIKTNVTVGFKPWSTTMLLVKSENFASVAHGGDTAVKSAAAAKIGASIVQQLAGPVSIKVGAMETITGRNVVREKALTVGLWYRF